MNLKSGYNPKKQQQSGLPGTEWMLVAYSFDRKNMDYYNHIRILTVSNVYVCNPHLYCISFLLHIGDIIVGNNNIQYVERFAYT